MKQTLQEKWKEILLSTAAVVIVFGFSFLFFSTQDPEILPDPAPEVIERNTFNPEKDPVGPKNQARPDGPVIMSPANMTVQNAAIGMKLPPINIQNQANRRQDIKFSFVELQRTQPDGTPVVNSDPESARQGKAYIQLNAERKSLGPGETFQLQGTIVGKPKTQTLTGSFGATIIGEKPPPSDSVKRGVSVQVSQDVRLSSIAYLIYPGDAQEKARLVDSRPLFNPNENGIQIAARVVSESEIPVYPEGEIIVRDRSGNTIVRQDFRKEQGVIPGQQRDIVTEKLPKIAPGEYELESRVVIAGKGQAIKRSFEIAPGGKLAAPAASIRTTASPDTAKPGEKIELTIQIRNIGNKSFAPKGLIQLYGYSSKEPLEERSFSANTIASDETGSLTETFIAPKEKGNYSYVVSVASDSGDNLTTNSAGLIINAVGEEDIALQYKIRDWLSEHPEGAIAIGIIFVGMLLLSIVALIALFSRLRENRRARQ